MPSINFELETFDHKLGFDLTGATSLSAGQQVTMRCTPLSRQFEANFKVVLLGIRIEIHRCGCMIPQRLMRALRVVSLKEWR
jgi:hypothetical protein